MNYYRVKVKCGHVGRNNYIPKSFYLKAEDGEEAALKARRIPRVKHDKKSAVLEVKKISKEEFQEGLRININDPYLRVTSIQEQRVLCPDLEEEIIREETETTYKKSQIRRHLIEKAKRQEWKNLRNYTTE